jgi:hypothetical protein
MVISISQNLSGNYGMVSAKEVSYLVKGLPLPIFPHNLDYLFPQYCGTVPFPYYWLASSISIKI